MKDMTAHRDRLRAYAAECAMIAGIAMEDEKRELFGAIAERLEALVSEIERVIFARMTNG